VPDNLDLNSLADAIADRLADRVTTAATQRYFSVIQAAEYSGLSADSIRSLMSSGKLTALRPVPGRVVIDKRELDSLIQSSCRPRRARGVYPRETRAG
jgi:Helix-turn-helix domain